MCGGNSFCVDKCGSQIRDYEVLIANQHQRC